MLSRLLPLCAVLLLSSTALAKSAPTLADQARAFPSPPILARAAVVMDASNGTVLAAKNPHLHLPMASTTKIMTALVALQKGRLSDRIVVPKAAFDYESDATVMGLKAGQTVTLRDLLYGLLLPSGADAANTIAIHYGGTEARFVAMMNSIAAQLGLRDTHYVNAHGLTARNHYTSAYDLATLGQYVSYLPDLMKIASTRTHTWNGHLLTNANRVLFWYPGVDGIKPGFTDDAGICQVLDVRRDGRHVIVALLNTPNLVTDARNLLNFGVGDFSWTQAPVDGDGPGLVLKGTDGNGSYEYFAGSGHYLRGRFWGAYVSNGGLEALGFPRTEPLRVSQVQVQYFQNGALQLDAKGKMTRLKIGLTAVPTPTTRPTVTPTPRPTLTPTPPREGTVSLTVQPTVTPTPRAKKATPTPKPLPSPTPTAPQGAVTARVFVAFQKAHWNLLGGAVDSPRSRHGYAVQTFTYGALVYDSTRHAVYLLPLTDQLLAARGYLAAHPGTAYPLSFAPVSVLKALAWPPYGKSVQS